jgi:hypothetical protein
MSVFPSTATKNIIPAVQPSVSDHALLRYLERFLGIDVEKTRQDVADQCAPSMSLGARSWSHGGVTFVFKGGVVVTVTPNQKPSQVWPSAAKAHGITPNKGVARSRREAHQMGRRHK